MPARRGRWGNFSKRPSQGAPASPKPVAENKDNSLKKETPLTGARLEEFFLTLHRCNGVIAAACQIHGITVQAVYDKKKSDKAFKTRIENTIMVIKEQLAEFRQNAMQMIDDKLTLAIMAMPVENLQARDAVAFRKLQAEIKGELGKKEIENTGDLPEEDKLHVI